MGISEFLSSWREKRAERKEYEKQLEDHQHAEKHLEQKKKTPMERELEKYKEQDRQKQITDEVLKRRREKKYEIEMRNTPINIKPIFRDEKNRNLFNSENVFTKKLPRPKINPFKGKNIFIERRKK
ncbi:MAG: hypothetical protein ABSG05_03525 [Candidatus Pacearchaeota archaeon]|jgi:hypothetical protein